MKDYKSMKPDELKEELARLESLLEDAEAERNFMAMQTGQHIKTSDYERLDRDIARYTEEIEAVKGLLAS